MQKIKSIFCKATIFFKFIAVTLLVWFVADQLLRILGSEVLPGHYDNQNEQRQATPYIEFKGAAGTLDHDRFGYRWLPDRVQEDALKIAFFGGSTGYHGDPPIASLIEARLNAGGSVRTQVANFSVVSSNHRQHLHNIIESRQLYNSDVVIFYGGYNEIVAPAYYDPRPGYPYNFYFRQETSPLYQLLLKYSPSFYLLDGVLSSTGVWSLTPLVSLRKSEKYYSDWWKEKIAANYFETIELAHSVTRAFESSYCGKPVFMFFYQPYQVPESFLELHNKLRAGVDSYDFGYDISNAFEKRGVSVFTDPVHVTQYGREIIAEEIAQNMLANEEFRKCITDFK